MQQEIEPISPERKHAERKQSDLWSKITSDFRQGKFPGASLGEIFFESMKTTFTAPGDEMPR
tara:strand:- start:295 stop:480 length:186 start_codon:yes stop_codon:yes gene_type:complete